MGRHSKPTKSGRSIATVTSALALTAGAGVVVPGVAQAQSSSAWDVIAECESDNRNVNNSTYPRSTASGYFQIVDGTWRSAGGTEFAPRAIQATRSQQLIVAQRIAERRGSLADWNASKGCWGGRISSAVPSSSSATVTESTRATRPAPAKQIKPKKQTAKSASAPVSKSGSKSGTYTVKAGDYLSRIAKQEDIGGGWRSLYEANRDKISNPALIFPGQQLDMPA